MPKISELALTSWEGTEEIPCIKGGVTYKARSYVTGSFSYSATGAAAPVTGTAYYTLIGKQVTIFLGDISMTSNDAFLTIVGLPTALQPDGTRVIPVVGIDNSAATPAYITLGASDTLYANVCAATITWTNSGTKGLVSPTITYLLTAA